jgi:hypothetical protein
MTMRTRTADLAVVALGPDSCARMTTMTQEVVTVAQCTTMAVTRRRPSGSRLWRLMIYLEAL